MLGPIFKYPSNDDCSTRSAVPSCTAAEATELTISARKPSAFSAADGGFSSALLPLLVTVFLAFFAVVFGTRHTDATEHQDGLILAEGPPSELGASRFRVAWRAADGTLEERFTEDPTALLATLTAEALARGERLEELSVTRPSLEDVYLELTELAA